MMGLETERRLAQLLIKYADHERNVTYPFLSYLDWKSKIKSCRTLRFWTKNCFQEIRQIKKLQT